MTRSLHFATRLLIVMALVGCAPYTGDQTAPLDPIAITADVAAQIVEEAVATNRTYVVQCAADRIPVKRCNEWSRFYTAFKNDARLAHAAFHRALVINDTKAADEQRARFREWARQIAELATYGGQ